MTLPWWMWAVLVVPMTVLVFVYVFMLSIAKYHDRLTRQIGANGRPKAPEDAE